MTNPPGNRADGSGEITELLNRCATGDTSAFEPAFRAVWSHLRGRAGHLMLGERADHTLQATALVHDAFLKLVTSVESWSNRHQFYGFACRLMRQLLREYAEKHRALKAGGPGVKKGRRKREAESTAADDARSGAPTSSERRRVARMPMDEIGGDAGPADFDALLDLEEGIAKLEIRKPRAAACVLLKHFGNLGVQEIAERLDVDRKTVSRDLVEAYDFLHDQLGRGYSG